MARLCYSITTTFYNFSLTWRKKEVHSSAKAVRLNHTVTISALPNIAACHSQSENKDYKLLTWTSWRKCVDTTGKSALELVKLAMFESETS